MRFRSPMLRAAIVVSFASLALADEIVIRTPVVTAQLGGTWQLQSDNKHDYKQELSFGGGLCGTWDQKERMIPVTIAWFVEGGEIRILHYYEPYTPGNYRVKTIMFQYKIDGDTLRLTKDGNTTSWKKIRQLPRPRSTSNHPHEESSAAKGR